MTRGVFAFVLAGVLACGGSQVGVTEGTDPAGDETTGDETPTSDTTEVGAGTEGQAGTNGQEPAVGETPSGKAANATILAGDGTHVELKSAWLTTTAVIVFYRGHWCPFCQKQLTELEKKRVEFEKLNANLVAVSADPEDIEKMRTKSGVSFELYADPDLGAIKAFDVLDEANGISRPAVFIVDQGGDIRFKYVGDNASDRVLLQVLLAELEKIQREEGKI